MADAVDTLVLRNGPKYYIARFQNISDGTGESAVAKVTLSGLLNANGVAPTRCIVEEIAWNIQGFTSVRLYWDHTTDDEITILSGNGYMDWSCAGGLVDPASAGDTGNIILTTNGGSSGATYSITMVVRLI